MLLRVQNRGLEARSWAHVAVHVMYAYDIYFDVLLDFLIDLTRPSSLCIAHC